MTSPPSRRRRVRRHSGSAAAAVCARSSNRAQDRPQACPNLHYLSPLHYLSHAPLHYLSHGIATRSRGQDVRRSRDPLLGRSPLPLHPPPGPASIGDGHSFRADRLVSLSRLALQGGPRVARPSRRPSSERRSHGHQQRRESHLEANSARGGGSSVPAADGTRCPAGDRFSVRCACVRALAVRSWLPLELHPPCLSGFHFEVPIPPGGGATREERKRT